VQEATTKKSGVVRQCRKHKKLALAPI